MADEPPDEPPTDELPAVLQVLGVVRLVQVKPEQVVPAPRNFPLQPRELEFGWQTTRPRLGENVAQAPVGLLDELVALPDVEPDWLHVGAISTVEAASSSQLTFSKNTQSPQSSFLHQYASHPPSVSSSQVVVLLP